MAYIREHKNSPFWVANWYDSNKKLKCRSTKIRVDGGKKAYNEALLVAEAYQSAESGKKTVDFIQEKIAEVSSSLLSETPNIPTFRKWAKEYLEIRERLISRSTFINDRRSINVLFEFLGEERADHLLCNVTKQDAMKFVDENLIRVEPKTVQLYCTALSFMFKSAKERGYVISNPFSGIRKRTGLVNSRSKVSKKPFTQSQLETLIKNLPPEWASMVKVSLYTGGQRLGDVATLEWEDVDFDDETVRFKTIKTGRASVIPFFPALKEHLEEWKKETGSNKYIHPFCAKKYLSRNRGYLSVAFTNFLKAYGITEQNEENLSGDRRHVNALSFHSLRHNAATILHKAGVPEAVAKEILGHSSSAVHRVYVRLGRDTLSDALKKIPKL